MKLGQVGKTKMFFFFELIHRPEHLESFLTQKKERKNRSKNKEFLDSFCSVGRVPAG